jgi:ubiquinone/menaquinone biosynthesis C-methylase UbiE
MPQMQTPDLSSLIRNEKDLTFYANSYIISAVLFASVQLGIFDRLAAIPATVADVAAQLALSSDATARTLNCCEALGLVEVDEFARYRNTPLTAKFLVTSAPSSIVPIILHHARHVYAPFGALVEAIRTGRPQIGTTATQKAEGEGNLYTILAAAPHEFGIFLRAMNLFSTGVGTWIAETVDLSHIHSMIDIGCGGGQVALELLTALPDLNIILVDLAAALGVAKETLGANGLAKRTSFLAADLKNGFPVVSSRPEAILISAVLGDWDEDVRIELLNNSIRQLPPGGLLLISETLLRSAEQNNLSASLLALYVLVITSGGSNFTENYWLELLSRLGIKEAKVFHNPIGGRDLIVARKS